MSMALLFPAALAALVALVIPLILHIARKTEQQPTDFSALRWLRQKPRPRSRLRFDEWPLLLIRLVLLALAVMWLAQPVLFGSADKSPYVAVVPGAQFDAMSFEDSRLHWLAPGFPPIDDAPPSAASMPIASLIRQIDAELPIDTPLTIVTPSVMSGADADRLHLSRKIEWRVTGGTMAVPAAKAANPPALSVRMDIGHRGALLYIRAAALAWQPAGRAANIESDTIDAPLPKTDHVLIWLAGGTLPDRVLRWAKAGGTALMASDARLPEGTKAVPLWRDEAGVPLAEAMPLQQGRLVRFIRPLRPADMPVLLDPDFPDHLRTLVDPAPMPSRVKAADYAPMSGGHVYDQPPRSLQPWIAMLIASLFLAERWMATRRNRNSAP
jgi:hypothetical protein